MDSLLQTFARYQLSQTRIRNNDADDDQTMAAIVAVKEQLNTIAARKDEVKTLFDRSSSVLTYLTDQVRILLRRTTFWLRVEQGVATSSVCQAHAASGRGLIRVQILSHHDEPSRLPLCCITRGFVRMHDFLCASTRRE